MIYYFLGFFVVTSFGFAWLALINYREKWLYHGCLAKMIRSEVKHIGYKVIPGVSDHELIIEYFSARVSAKEKGEVPGQIVFNK